MSNIKYLLIFLSILFSSCATRYIAPFSLPAIKTAEVEHGKVSLFYKEAPLNEKGNYVKNAQKKDYHFVQVILINQSSEDILLTHENIQAFVEYQPAEVVVPRVVQRKLRQKKAWYFLYLIPGIFVTTEGVSYYPVLTPVGVYNFIRASIANREFYESFMVESLIGQKVQSGQTASGWVCIRRKEGVANVLLRYDE